jgi:uncharacterized protein (TIGR00255 family)
MTGFAVKTIALTNKDGSRAHITMSVKSLNSRFFEATCKIPAILSHLETECIKMMKESLIRGYVVLGIQVSNPNVFKGSVEADSSIALSYIRAVETLQKTSGISGSFTINDLVTLPNVFAMEEKQVDDQIKNTILDAMKDLLEALVKTRKQEGLVLLTDLQKRATIIEQEMKTIEARAEAFMQERKALIVQKLSMLEQETPADGQRNVLYYELDKIDIHEEIVRFNNHLTTFHHHVESHEIEKGRRLDFLLQELAREINTISAKCSDVTIGTHAINIKVEIEKAREQVQNIV